MTACPRCRGGDVLAVARVPHGWTTATGKRVRGSAEVVLCARCDAADPVVARLLNAVTVEDLAGPLRCWLARARPPALDEEALEAEIEASRRGEL
ncbi:DUF6300 family protein [Nonomuraea sp. H19]|uniref:DUF6300 family protein n=1 Tax=Nonomuraea sp. H19 TaxID=3452206 RepID=UPI003F8B8604